VWEGGGVNYNYNYFKYLIYKALNCEKKGETKFLNLDIELAFIYIIYCSVFLYFKCSEQSRLNLSFNTLINNKFSVLVKDSVCKRKLSLIVLSFLT
jgi:hypothetical protein